MHVVFEHCTRRGDRDSTRWNISGDFAINPIVIDSGMSLPNGGLLDDQYRDMTADHIYSILPEGTGKGPGGEHDDSPGIVLDAGTDDYGQPIEDVDTKDLEIEWTIATAQAAQQAKSMGQLPAGLEKIIAEILEPKVDWRQKARQFMTAHDKEEYSWSKPDRRFIHEEIYIPGRYSERLGCVVIGRDTSGSVTDEEQKQFLGEFTSILRECNPTSIYLVDCDTEVKLPVETYTQDDLPLRSSKIRGGGGTYFSPVFDWVKEEKLQPDCLVYLTDLGSTDFGEAPDYPVLWVSTCAGEAPWGEVVHI